jgi:hypothetical protein
VSIPNDWEKQSENHQSKEKYRSEEHPIGQTMAKYGGSTSVAASKVIKASNSTKYPR